MTKSKDIAFLGIFLAFAILAGYIERVIPSPVAMVPGIKLGLANVVVIILMYIRDDKMAFSLNIIRIIASGILFSGPWGMLYSLAGGLLSFVAMYISKKSNIFGLIGVSVMGGIFHNIGQICVAVLVVENVKLFYYMPVLLLSGIITGVLIGFVSWHCIIRLREARI